MKKKVVVDTAENRGDIESHFPQNSPPAHHIPLKKNKTLSLGSQILLTSLSYNTNALPCSQSPKMNP
jgi:hypothetical protein